MLTHVYVPTTDRVLRDADATIGESPEEVGNNSPAGTYVRECAQVAEVLAETLLVNADTLHARNLTRLAGHIARRLAPTTLLGLAQVASDLGLHDSEVHVGDNDGFHTTPVLALRSAVVGIGTEVALHVLHECTVTAAETVTFPEDVYGEGSSSKRGPHWDEVADEDENPLLLACVGQTYDDGSATVRLLGSAEVLAKAPAHRALHASVAHGVVVIDCTCTWRVALDGDSETAYHRATEHVRAALAE